jgi:hypothetical protein
VSGYDYAARQVIAPEHETGAFLTSQKRPFLRRYKNIEKRLKNVWLGDALFIALIAVNFYLRSVAVSAICLVNRLITKIPKTDDL